MAVVCVVDDFPWPANVERCFTKFEAITVAKKVGRHAKVVPVRPEEVHTKDGPVFDSTNLRKEWHKACVLAKLGTLTEVVGKRDPRYTGLIIHDLRRSAIKNLMKAGVDERVAMKISGHKTRDVFDRYHIVDTEDVVEAMRRAQASDPAQKGLVSNGEKSVKKLPAPRGNRR
jgi:integrase